MTLNKKRLAITATAASLAATILLGGTLAWQSVSQKAKNEANGIANPGGRLHDYFNGENKDVFVENFTDPEDDGVPIYARIRLDEYMEIGEGAGDADASNRYVTVVGATETIRPELNNPATWITHHPAEHAPQGGVTADSPMHEYMLWEMGGKTVYMPTFNKDKDSLKADINGTYEGPDDVAGPNPNVDNVDDRYEDYKTYVLTQEEENLGSNLVHTVTDTEQYADGTSEAPVEHTAQETLEATVITMEDWKNNYGSKPGPYWVYDMDGWAYWAQPIQPGEATGPLLTGITPAQEPDDDWFYAINVVGQFATAGDWGTPGDGDNGSGGDGFYKDGITDDGLTLLNTISDRLPEVTYVGIPSENGVIYVTAGIPHILEANVLVKNPTGAPSETHVTWSFADPEAEEVRNGTTFTAKDSMVGNSYQVTATSTFDPTKSATATVYVMPEGANGAVEGEQDGKMYVNFGDNTYKVINPEDGSLSDYYCAGMDKIIGNEDDLDNVLVADELNTTYGQKFLGPNADGSYWAMGEDRLLGTKDDIRVTCSPAFPDNMTHLLADTITITAADAVDDKVSVKVGKMTAFSASVTLRGEPVSNQKVTWSVSGNRSKNTVINASGVLRVGDDEPVGTMLTIKAESQYMTGLSTYITVEVQTLDYQDLADVTPGSMATVTIDGVEWYVLAKDNGRALLWSVDPVGEAREFGSYLSWEQSTVRSYFNDAWLPTNSVLNQVAVETDISTRVKTGIEDWITTQDKVFFLSEADLFGTFNGKATTDARDYTYGNQVLVPNIEMRKFDNRIAGSYAWTRNVIDTNNSVIVLQSNGTRYSQYQHSDSGCRPALWVKMNQDVSQ